LGICHYPKVLQNQESRAVRKRFILKEEKDKGVAQEGSSIRKEIRKPLNEDIVE